MPLTDHWLTATDGTRLRLCSCGTGDRILLLLPGRTEPPEKYIETAQRLCAFGHRVFIADWRGQGRSGGRPAHNSQIGHAEDFDIHAADLSQVLRAVQDAAPGSPITLLAHSMGGGIALRYLQTMPAPPAALRQVITLGAMLTLPDQILPRPAVRLLAETACLLGLSRHYAPGQGNWGTKDQTFAGNGRTSDPNRFTREVTLLTHQPDLQVGGPSWGWIRAAYRLSARLAPGFSPPVPLHLMQGDLDPYVPLPILHRFHIRTPGSTLTLLPGALHEPLMERDAIQTTVWDILSPLLLP